MPTFEDAFQDYMSANPNGSESTNQLYNYEAKHYLGDWLSRPRHLQASCLQFALQRASNHPHPLLHHALDTEFETEPRMNLVEDLVLPKIVGVKEFSCTTLVYCLK